MKIFLVGRRLAGGEVQTSDQREEEPEEGYPAKGGRKLTSEERVAGEGGSHREKSRLINARRRRAPRPSRVISVLQLLELTWPQITNPRESCAPRKNS